MTNHKLTLKVIASQLSSAQQDEQLTEIIPQRQERNKDSKAEAYMPGHIVGSTKDELILMVVTHTTR